jgi:hypothetical protein
MILAIFAPPEPTIEREEWGQCPKVPGLQRRAVLNQPETQSFRPQPGLNLTKAQQMHVWLLTIIAHY